MNVHEWPLTHHQNCTQESVYYAIIDRKGKILSMNVAMNNEFGRDSLQKLEYFQSLLGENDRLLFSTLLAKEDDASPSVPVNLYTYVGANREIAIKWSVFKLIPLNSHPGYFLCTGYHQQPAVKTEDSSADNHSHVQKALPQTLLKVLENERLWIGQELHDNVNQLLCSAKLHLDVLEVYKADNIWAKQKTLDILLEAVEEIKKLSKGLMLQRLKKETLLESVKVFIDDFKRINKINVLFGIHHFNEELLTENKKVHIYRILQEQFRNIVQHSRAKTIAMTLETGAQNIELIIDDDGIGFDPHQQVMGIGLISIRERVKLLNGQFNIDSSPGYGCRIHVIIPI